MGLFDNVDLDALEQGYQQHLATQSSGPAPVAGHQSLLGKVGNFVQGAATGLAQPFIQVGKGLYYAPQAINREIHNKSISDIQQKAYGTTDSGEIAKKIVGSTAQVAAYAAAPGLSALKPAAALVPKIAANAAIGGVIGGGSSLENNGNTEDVIKNILLGGAIGGGTGAASGVLRKVLTRAPKTATTTAGVDQLSPEAKQAMLQKFRTQAATPTTETAPVSAPATPQVVTKPGATVIQAPTPAPMPAPSPTNVATKALDTYDNTNNYLGAPQQPANPSYQLPVPEGTPPVSPEVSDLLSELQAKTSKVLAPKTNASDLHVNPSTAQAIERPTAPEPVAPVKANPTLPEGYTSKDGSVFSPSGKELTIGEVQSLTQPKFLSDFEQARNSGNVDLMKKIASSHPGDARVNAPELFPGNRLPSEAAPELAGNTLQKLGRGIQKAGVKLDSKASVFGARKESELQQFMKSEGLLKAGSNPESIYKHLPTKMSEYQTKIGDLIAGDKTLVPAEDLKAEIKANVVKQSLVRGNGKKTQEIIGNVSKIIDDASDKDGNLSPSSIYHIKQILNEDLDNAYKRMAKGAPLSEADQTAMTARDLINDKLPQAARDLGRKESNLHDLAVILDKDRKTGLKIPNALAFGLPHAKTSRGLAHAMESLQTGVGAPVEALGNLQAKLGGGLLGKVANRTGEALNSPAASELAPVAAAGATNMPDMPQSATPVANQQPAVAPGAEPSLTNLVDQVQNQRQNSAGSTDNSFGLTSDQVQQAMLTDLLTTGGENNAVLSKIYAIVQEQEKAQKPQTLSQTAVNQVNTIQRAQSGLDQIESAFNGTTNTGKGLLSKVEASPVGNFTGGRGVQEVNKAIQANLTSIATALGMGTSSRELEALAAQLPNTQDTQASAKAKLGVVRGQIQQYLSQYLNNQSNFVQPNNSTLDALAQVSAGGVQQ